MAAEPPLITIVGPTASGKTNLAIRLAEQFNGEIICADSRTIYKFMNIGTAKPSLEDQARVAHWGVDLIEPNQRFTAKDFQAYAVKMIADIRRRGKVPVMVGGTGLYVDSLLYRYNFPSAPSDDERRTFETMTKDELHQYCVENNVELPENDKNKRHLIQAALRKDTRLQRSVSILPNSYIVGIATDKETLRTRIFERTEHMFENGVVQEATLLGKRYGWEHESMTGNIYRLVKLHLEGELTRGEIKDRNTTADVQLAKRQMTWFRRNPDILWANVTGAESYIQSLLASE